MEGIAVKEIETNNGRIALPCLDVFVVPIEQIQANTYNPNHVSPDRMELLRTSIYDNGFCFPVVTSWADDLQKYVVIDGFHRYLTFLNEGAKEIAIIDLKLTDAQRMQATIQFNRARGIHSVELMGDLVRALAEQGAEDEDIARKLGMEGEEVYRLKQITGIAELFKNQIYSKSWVMVEVSDGEL
jgi:ParB-like chromosome segregation protein Spo0J